MGWAGKYVNKSNVLDTNMKKAQATSSSFVNLKPEDTL